MDSHTKQVCAAICDANAVCIARDRPFVLANGSKSSIYLDVRKLIYYPPIRDATIDRLAALVRSTCTKENDFIISGAATADIPFSILVADRLKCPSVYMRPPKKHGLGNLIEGGSVRRKTVVHVADLINSGVQGVNHISTLRENGAHINAYVAIVCRSIAGQLALEQHGVKVSCLCRLLDVLYYLRETNRVSDDILRPLIDSTAAEEKDVTV